MAVPLYSPYFDSTTRQDFKWTEYHKTPSQLEELRKLGDDMCDNAVKLLDQFKHDSCINKEQDILTMMYQYIQYKKEQDPLSLHKDAVHLLLSTTVPPWVDFDQIERGQWVFWKYCLPHSLLLLMALVAGLGAPKINATLLATGYISSRAASPLTTSRGKPMEQSFKRLLETTQWVMDAMTPGSLYPGRLGWKSSLRVRILHSQVRLRILGSHSMKYSVDKYGIPINQEDMIGTALAFFYPYLHHFNRMHVHVSNQEVQDALAAWRYICYLMGIQDVYNPALSPQVARGWYESIVIHLIEPDDTTRWMVNNILHGTPFHYDFLTGIFRHVVGDPHADGIGLPRVSFVSKCQVYIWIIVCKLHASSFSWPLLGESIILSNRALAQYRKYRLCQWIHRVLGKALQKRTKFPLIHSPGDSLLQVTLDSDSSIREMDWDIHDSARAPVAFDALPRKAFMTFIKHILILIVLYLFIAVYV